MNQTAADALFAGFGYVAVVLPAMVLVLTCATVDSDHSSSYKTEKIFRLLAAGFYGTAGLAAISGMFWLAGHQQASYSGDTVFKSVLGLGAAEGAALVCWLAGWATSYFRDVTERDPYLDLTRVLSFR